MKRLIAIAIYSLLLVAGPTSADGPARISIIIDDMGDHKKSGYQALALPGAITYAFLPHTPYSTQLAEAAHKADKEVMLHLPMQAMNGKRLGPGGLTMEMKRNTFMNTLRKGLQSVPHVVGVNNHMGSLLTRHPAYMQWLMEGIKEVDDSLYFIDSRTTHHTVAQRMAEEAAVPTLRRDVFLDDNPDANVIRKQVHLLIKKARRNGYAVGIGHPYPSTLKVLAEELPKIIRDRNFELVPVSALLTPVAGPRIALTETEKEQQEQAAN